MRNINYCAQGENEPMQGNRREERRASVGDVAQADWLGRLQDASFSRAGQAVRKAYPPQRRMTGPQLASYLQRRTYALASSTRPDGRAHAAPTLFCIYAEAFWLPTVSGAVRIGNVRAHPWLALSIVEGEHDTHAAVLTEGPGEVLATVPEDVRNTAELRNRGGSVAWATTWLRMAPQRLLSFAELAWQDVACSS
jgi:hypothetical protein